MVDGIEAWTLKEWTVRRVEAFEVWFYRCTIKKSSADHITNEEVLRQSNTLVQYTEKLKYLGHIFCNEKCDLLQLIMLRHM
jgi:hypothetical protein